MARKRYSGEDALKLLREIGVHLHDGLDVVSVSEGRDFGQDVFLLAQDVWWDGAATFV